MNKFLYTIFAVFVTLACTKQQNQNKLMASSPLVVEAKGVIVSEGGMSNAKTVLAGVPTRMPAGKATIVYTDTNEFPARQPKIILAGTPLIITPGQGYPPIPKTVRAIDNPFIAGMPVVETAKDAHIKDQNPQNFSTFGKHQGLNYNSIHCQLQDDSGNLWFCTYGGGVSRYDGKSFTHFTTKEGLSNDRVWSVLQDKSGNLWFGTDGGGVSRYDGKFFTHFTKKEGLSGNSVMSMLQDRSGDIWFATTEGLSKYDGKAFTYYTTKEGLCDNTILSILQDKSGSLWFGSGEHGVSKYDGKTFTNFSEKEGLINNTVFYILQDRDKNIWFGTNGGASRYDGKSFANYTEKEGLSNNKVYSIFQDIHGSFWFGTGGGGISKLSFSDYGYSNKPNISNPGIFTHISEAEGLCNNIVYSILKDESGNLWFGTNEGVSKYGGNLFTHFTRNEGLNNNKVFSVLMDKTGNLWFGTFGGGVSKYDGKSFTNFTEKEGLVNGKVFSIFQDKSGNIWFGTDGGGVSKYDGKSFVNFTQKEGLSNNKVFCILQDKTGNIWFGTYGGGVLKYDGKSFTNYTTAEGLCNNFVLSIFQDKSDNFWFGTDGGGVSNLIFTKSEESHGLETQESHTAPRFVNYTKKEGLPNNYVFSIFQDKEDNLWFGTGGGGVAKYDGKYFTHYTEKEGLCNNNVLSITQDKNDNLWFGTRFGLSKLKAGGLNLKASTLDLPMFNNFEYEDGFLGIGCNRGAICQDRTGTIWIGTNDRLTAYHAEGDISDSISPEIQLTGISLFNEKIKWSDLLSYIPAIEGYAEAKDTSIILENGVTIADFNFDATSKWYYIPQNLSLKYDNNFLIFSFIGISQIHNKRMRYQYKLEGLDKTWSALTHRSEASYGNLSSGTYIFKVKAVNGEGYWSKEFAYKFTIRPPWWKSGWFQLFLIVFILASLLLFYGWRIASLKRQQRYLEQVVKDKTVEVVRQSNELQNINEMLMQQKEALEIANATKDKFFSIIAHDLRSPFNGFLGLTEIMAKELASLTLADIQDLAIEMNKSATNLYHLLENLLQWSLMQQTAIPFNPKIVPLLSILDDSIVMMLESAKNKKILLTYDIPGNIRVYADANSIQTIFRNLVSNAIKFTNKGGQINISVWIDASQKVVVAIKDSGIGMSPEMLNNLFRIDFKTNRVGTAGELSTGLGLFLCKDFVEKHGGEIWAESKINQGSIFYFTLPTHN